MCAGATLCCGGAHAMCARAHVTVQPRTCPCAPVLHPEPRGLRAVHRTPVLNATSSAFLFLRRMLMSPASANRFRLRYLV